MELPKNITQIGENHGDCKVYAEDYVISYLKQLNRTAGDRKAAVALYGRREEEEGISYLFLFGACRLTLIQQEVRHLSQAQYQEIERLRRKYFPDYMFLGYRLLDGEMIEGFHICEQEICRYIEGYAQFYEKNEQMLSYMLEMRKEVSPEQVDQKKYEEVKKRQEERRAASQTKKPAVGTAAKDPARKRPPVPERVQQMRYGAASVFVLLCLLGFVVLKNDAEGRSEELQATAKQWVDGMMDKQLLDGTDAVAVSGTVEEKEVLVMEDKLEQALLEENSAGGQPAEESGQGGDQTEFADGSDREREEETSGETPEETPVEPEKTENTENAEPAEPEKTVEDAVPEDSTPAAEASSDNVRNEEKLEAVAYVIQSGDTLIGISRRQYGNEERVADICLINKISDPDNIKKGQVIMLPK